MASSITTLAPFAEESKPVHKTRVRGRKKVALCASRSTFLQVKGENITAAMAGKELALQLSGPHPACSLNIDVYLLELLLLFNLQIVNIPREHFKKQGGGGEREREECAHLLSKTKPL